MSASFNSLAISLVIRRETGLLKRLRLSPLPTWTLLTSILLSTLLIAFAQVVLMLAVGRWAFGVHLPSSASGIGALVVVLVLGGLSFAALGIAMSTLIPNQQAAGPLTSTVFFVLLFLSGLWFPLKSGSALAKISTFFPIRHFITAVFKTFNHPGDISLVRARPADRRDLGCGGCRGRASPLPMGAAPHLTTSAAHPAPPELLDAGRLRGSGVAGGVSSQARPPHVSAVLVAQTRPCI